MTHPTLIVMLKEPRPGRVKTRLGKDIGTIDATWWFRHQTHRLLHTVYAPRRWSLVLAVAPDKAAFQSRFWPAHLPRVPQGPGDLGQRMARLLRSHAGSPVCIMGGDIPGVAKAHIAQAFRAADSHDVVFGPAKDGGFWLVGQSRLSSPPKTAFQEVRWSSDHALKDSIKTMQNRRIAFVETMADVDTGADLKRTLRIP